MKDPSTRRLAWAAWAAVCLVWGTTLPAIRVAVRHIPPALLSGTRFLIAGVLLLAVLALLGVKGPRDRREWLVLVLTGALLALANATLNTAARHITSGPGTLLTVFAALWMVLLESLRPGGDRLSWRVALGLALGFCGAGVLFLDKGPAVAPVPVSAYALMMLSTFAWGLASVLLRHTALKTHTLMSSAWQMIFAALALIPLGMLMGERIQWPWPTEAAIAYVYLIIFGSLVGFVAYVYMVEKLPAAVVGSYTYVNPLVAVAVGALMLGEPVAPSFWIAAVLVLAGVYLAVWPHGKKA